MGSTTRLSLDLPCFEDFSTAFPPDLRYLFYLTSHLLVSKLISSLFRKFTSPSIADFVSSGEIYLQPAKFLVGNFPQLDVNVFNQYEDEYHLIVDEITHLYESNNNLTLYAPKDWKIESMTGLVIYSLIRHLRPSNVMETGVANGHSTFIILSALAKNNFGTLHSIDTTKSCGSLLQSNHLLKRWRLHVLTPPYEYSFKDILSQIPMLDMFFHDSDHSYHWMSHEFSTTLARLNSSSVILSDDVDLNYAFLNLAQKLRSSPSFLFDSRKILGFLKYN